MAAGTRRQDAFRIVPPGPDGHLVLIACDGAGSAGYGGEGASIAAWTMASSARSWLRAERRPPDVERISTWMSLARLRIAAAAFERWTDPREFATTLAMAITDGETVTTAHVGDGAIVGRDAATGEWLSLSWPEHGEFLSTTWFVTDADPRLRIASHAGPIDALAVMTDGIERLGLDFGMTRPHAPFLDAMLAPVLVSAAEGCDLKLSRQLAEYLDSDRINERTDDDKTLIVASSA